MKLQLLKKPIFLVFTLFLINFSVDAQEKVIDIQGQTENLISSLERISANEIKLQIILERTAAIPQEELVQSEIPAMIERFDAEKLKEERRVVSIEYYLKSINTTVEISEGRFNKLSDSIKAHVLSDALYVVTNPSN